jgi:hypothetical protein
MVVSLKLSAAILKYTDKKFCYIDWIWIGYLQPSATGVKTKSWVIINSNEPTLKERLSNKTAFFHGYFFDILYLHAMKSNVVGKTNCQNILSLQSPSYDAFFFR